MSETEHRPAGAGHASEPPAPRPGEQPDDTRSMLLASLSTRRALRRVFLLREALGPPLALRGRGSDTVP